MRSLAIVAATFGGVAVAFVAGHMGAYLRLARVRRAARADCPFEDDDMEHLSLLEVARLIAAEGVAAMLLLGACLFPRPRPRHAGARRGLLVVSPWWLPARALALLGVDVTNDGTAVDYARASRRGDQSRTARLVSRLEHLHRRTGGRVDVIAYGGATQMARGVVAMAPPAALGRLVLIGGPGDTSFATPPDRITAIHSRDDVWLQPPSRAAVPGATQVQLSGVGHLGLVVAPHVLTIVSESVSAPVDAPVPQPMAPA